MGSLFRIVSLVGFYFNPFDIVGFGQLKKGLNQIGILYFGTFFCQKRILPERRQTDRQGANILAIAVNTQTSTGLVGLHKFNGPDHRQQLHAVMCGIVLHTLQNFAFIGKQYKRSPCADPLLCVTASIGVNFYPVSIQDVFIFAISSFSSSFYRPAPHFRSSAISNLFPYRPTFSWSLYNHFS